MNKAAVNICSGVTQVCLASCPIPGEELLAHRVGLQFYWQTPNCFSQLFTPIYTPTSWISVPVAPFPHQNLVGDWNAKVGSQETPGVTGKFGLGIWNEAGQRLIEFCQENTLVIANNLFQQHKRRLYTWTSPDGQHRNQIDYVLCSQ